MSDSSEAAIFKICAQLQKEIEDLKCEDDLHCFELAELEKGQQKMLKRLNEIEIMVKAVFNLLSK